LCKKGNKNYSAARGVQFLKKNFCFFDFLNQISGSSEAVAIDQVHLVEIILIIHACTALRGEIPNRRVHQQQIAFIAAVRPADVVLTRLLVVAEAEDIEVAVAARLPGSRLPVLLIILAPGAAAAEVATAATWADLTVHYTAARKPPEATCGAASLEAIRPCRALTVTGILVILLLLCCCAAPLVHRLLGGRIKRVELPREEVLPVLLLSRRHARLQLLNDAVDRIHDCCGCFRVYCFETYCFS